MTYNVLMGTLNPTHSLIHCLLLVYLVQCDLRTNFLNKSLICICCGNLSFQYILLATKILHFIGEHFLHSPNSEVRLCVRYAGMFPGDTAKK